MNIKDQTFAAFALANQDRKKSLLQYVSEGATNADLEAAGYTPAEYAAAFPPVKEVAISKEFDRDRQAGSNPDTLQEVKPSFLQRVSDSLFTPPSIDGTYYDPKGLPIGAMPDTDLIWGKDELGNSVRVTDTGDRYIIPKLIPKDEKKRSLDEKVDIFKGKVAPIYEAVKENPLGVAKDVGLGVAKSMWDTVGAFNNPNPTIGDAMDVAGLVSLPSAPGLFTKFDPNVVRMFAGPEAKNFPHLMEAEASVRRKAGEDPQKIWEDTGIQYLPDGRPVFQIDPAGATVKHFDHMKQTVPTVSAENRAAYAQGKSTNTNDQKGIVGYQLTDIIDFPEFYDNYPQLKDFQLIFDPSLGRTRGEMDIAKKKLVLNMDYLTSGDDVNLKSTVLHELQHGIQAAERTSGGAAPSYFFDKAWVQDIKTGKWERTGDYTTGAADMTDEVENYNILKKDIDKSISDFNSKFPNMTKEEDEAASNEIARKMKLLASEEQRLNDYAFKKYQENPGEVEARAAQLWAKLTPEERLKTPPLEIYNQAAVMYEPFTAKLGEEFTYGHNYMPNTRFPTSQEEALKRLDPNAEMPPAQSVDQTTAALGTVPKVIKPKGPKVTAPYQKGDNSKVVKKVPDGKFGVTTINTHFDIEPGEPLGDIRNISMDTLARVKLGEYDASDALLTHSITATPKRIDSVKNYLARLDNDPEFVDYTNKLKEDTSFDPWEEYVNRKPDTNVSFRSPILEVVDQIEFPKKGIEGYQLLSELKNSPSVRKAEFDTVTTAIDPKARYTKEEAKSILEKDAWKVGSRQYKNYSGTQRQTDMLDPETDYFERAIVAERPDGTTFIPTGSHFDQSALAHSRASIREDAKGPYTLAEESQTDLLQHGFQDPVPARGPESVVDVIEDRKEEIIRYGGLGESGVDLLKLKALYEEFYHVESRNLPKEALKKRNEIVKDFVDHLPKKWDGFTSEEDFIKNATTGDLWDSFQTVKEGFEGQFDIPSRQVSQLLNDNFYAAKGMTDLEGTIGISQPPIKNIEESIKLVLDDLIAASVERGVTRIVMPPLDRIVSKRFPIGSEGYLKAMDPKSGFSKTYVSGFKKVLGDYQNKLGTEDFKVAPIDMNYSTTDDFSSLSRVGTEIDFSGLVNKGYDLSKPHFADGGLVGYAQGGTVEDEQMNRLMQDGGMADAGVAQEPVTGNEVPPGALPSEVRDDVPVQLSEGEYVVPADVLRFFGVRFFEDLRNQAKQGMAEMQSNGRIGGASVDSNGVPAEDDDELTPEEEQMLQAAMGGQEAPTGMAEGGVVPFDRSKFTLNAPSDRESRKYIDPKTGITQMFQFFMGSPVSPIPTNFVPWTQELQDAAAKPVTPTIEQPKVTRNEDRDSVNIMKDAKDSGGSGFNYSGWAEKNYDAITANPYQFGLDALTDDSGKFASKGLGIAGLATGILPLAFLGMGVKAGNKMQNIAEASAALQLMEAKGLTGTADYVNLSKVIGIATDALPSAQQLLIEKHMAATGDNYVKAITGMQGKATPAVAPTTPVEAAPRASTSSNTATANIGYGSGKVDPGLAKAAGLVQKPEAVKPAPARTTSTPSGPKVVTSTPAVAPKSYTAPTTEQLREKQKQTTKVTNTLNRGRNIGGFKDGGLIARPTKK